MIVNWEQRVGPMEATMHWASDEMYSCIHHMLTMDLIALQREFTVRRRLLDPVTSGVMEVLFMSSAFHLPCVKKMGDRFYVFASVLILLNLDREDGSDRLNLFLYNLVLPQTVIQLEPHRYRLDSLLPPITVALTIQGKRVEEGTTELVVYGQSSLKVWAREGIRFYDLDFVHDVIGCDDPCEEILDISGDRNSNPKVHLNCVKFVGAGFKTSNLDMLYCNFVWVIKAKIGVSMEHVRHAVFVGSSDVDLAQAGFEDCVVAVRARDGVRLSMSHQTFGDVKRVFDVRLREACQIRDCLADECIKLGSILLPGCRNPVFTNFEVDEGTEELRSRLCIPSDVYPIVYVANPPVWEFDRDAEEPADAESMMDPA